MPPFRKQAQTLLASLALVAACACVPAAASAPAAALLSAARGGDTGAVARALAAGAAPDALDSQVRRRGGRHRLQSSNFHKIEPYNWYQALPRLSHYLIEEYRSLHQ